MRVSDVSWPYPQLVDAAASILPGSTALAAGFSTTLPSSTPTPMTSAGDAQRCRAADRGDRERLLHRSPPNRRDRPLPARSGPGTAAHHPRPPRLPRARQPSAADDRRGTARPHDGLAERRFRQLRPSCTGDHRRRALVGATTGRSDHRSCSLTRPPTAAQRGADAVGFRPDGELTDHGSRADSRRPYPERTSPTSAACPGRQIETGSSRRRA